MNLVTGATGHIGNVLVRNLVSQGEKVKALLLPGEDRRPLQDLDIEIVEGDILDEHSLESAFSGTVENVYHLAGVIYIQPGKNDLVRRVNVQGTCNILQACRKAGVGRLVYTSSIHAIARAPKGICVDETYPFDPQTGTGEYDRSKAEATLAVLEAVQSGLDAVIVCPTGVIGPHDYRFSEMGSWIWNCMQQKVQFTVDGAYDFVDVRDVAAGLALANQKGRAGETYILAGEQVTLKNLAEMVLGAARSRALLLKVPLSFARFVANLAPFYARLTRQKPLLTRYSLETVLGNSLFTCAKASRELGYQPRSLAESVTDTVNWLRQVYPLSRSIS